MSLNGSATQWEYLANEADAGRLKLDPGVAADCVAACEGLINDLKGLERLAVAAQRAEGFGGFDSGRELAEMYGKKGIGGVDAIDDILRQHRVVVSLIRDTISASVTRVGAQDDANSQQISAIEPG